MGKRYQPSLYEINTRAWLNQNGNPIQLKDIDEKFWEFLKSRGIDYVWLMGIWKTSSQTAISFDRDPVRMQSYNQEVGYTINREDVIGSPYAIDRYEIDPTIGTRDDLINLRDLLNGFGIKLILDFVPNHYSRHTRYLDECPEHFVQVDSAISEKLNVECFEHKYGLFAYGRDPKSGSWHDTVQVNYLLDETRSWMIDQLMEIAELCDGVRCDMAMLMLNEIFTETWGHENFQQSRPEFWTIAIRRIRDEHPDFTFIAEVYWDLEWQLQQMGFDYTYDKRLLDRLKEFNYLGIHMHLVAGIDFQSKLARFLENHDEERVLNRFSVTQSKAAAVLTFTLPGLRFFHQGQWEGRMRRIPVQLGKFPREVTFINTSLSDVPPHVSIYSDDIWTFYLKLTTILHLPVFRFGQWQKIDFPPHVSKSIFGWTWSLKLSKILVLVNFANRLEEFDLDLKYNIRHFQDLWLDESLMIHKNNGSIFSFGMRPYQFRFLKLNIDAN